jgi:hypothetical protein
METKPSFLWIRGNRESPLQVMMPGAYLGTIQQVTERVFSGERTSLGYFYDFQTLNSSTVLTRLREDPSSRHIPHLFYYFNFRDPATETCENFLRSTLSQLLNFLPSVPLPLKELYERSNSGTLRPTTKDLTTCFIDIVKTLEEVRLFGDGFDECSEWNALWTFLTRVCQSDCRSLRFLFTSRPERDIRDAVYSLNIPFVDLTRPEMTVDIQKYITERLESPRFNRIHAGGRELIRETLTMKAQGMRV